jgi:hypothetical protein
MVDQVTQLAGPGFPASLPAAARQALAIQAAVAYIDRIDELSCTERGGCIIALTRKARVVKLPIGTDYTNLWIALSAAGIPTVPSTLPGKGFEGLVLVTRTAKLVEGDPSTVDVSLDYEKVLDNQELFEPAGVLGDGIIYGKSKCSIQQKPTNQFRKWQHPGAPWATETVQHTFPVGKQPSDAEPNVPIVQGGEFHAVRVHSNLQIAGYINTNLPQRIANEIAGTVNSLFWMDGESHEWLCAEVGYELLGLSKDIDLANKPRRRYRYTFEFQHNPDSWDADIVFIDGRYGRPPPGLVPGVGYKTINYLRPVDFNAFFNAKFEGLGGI